MSSQMKVTLAAMSLFATLLAGCGAGQLFGPSVRSDCQGAAVESESVKIDILAAVTEPEIPATRKAALKQCNREMRGSLDACFANPTTANAAVMRAKTTECRGLLLPSEVTQ